MKKITSSANPYIKEISKLKGSPEMFMAGGEKLVKEAFEYAEIISLFVSEDKEREYAEYIKKVNDVYILSPHIMSKICDQKTPQGIAALVKTKKQDKEAKFIVALENVADPGNVGTMIRTADAAGADVIIMSENCANAFSAKTVRASMGSVMHLDILRTDKFIETISDFKKNGYEIITTHLNGKSAKDISERCVIIFGNESSGASDEAVALCDKLLKIDMYGRAESLNVAVAAGIVLFDAARSMRAK